MLQSLKKHEWSLLILSLVINDVLMTGLAFKLAFNARFRWALPIFRLEVIPDPEFYTQIVIGFLPVWVILFALQGLYRRDNLLGGTLEYAKVFRVTTIGLLLVIIVGFLEPDFIFARGWLVLVWLFDFLFVSIGRFSIRRVVYRLRQRGLFMAPALLVGANMEARLLAEQLAEWKTSGLNLMGVIADGEEIGEEIWDGVTVLGTLADLEEFTSIHNIQEIILATSALDRGAMLEIFKQCAISNSIHLRLSSGLFEIVTTGLQVKEIAYVPLVSIDKVRLRGMDQALKVLLDYLVTIPLFIFLAPFLGLIALMIKLDSRGPVVYRRRVMGLNQSQFDAFKFRTMYTDGDEILRKHPELKTQLDDMHKLKDDPRVTRIGRFLRKYSLDELPQFINVLRGEMSLVGPRMISPPEMEKYNHWGINLLTVKPGITGLWQVSGRSDVSYEERVRLDMYYIRNWTIWFDLYLLLQTPSAVLKSRGAY
jgi:exopolysaccharide biosynthesis polyprenyl glycosylphosphotransferase